MSREDARDVGEMLLSRCDTRQRVPRVRFAELPGDRFASKLRFIGLITREELIASRYRPAGQRAASLRRCVPCEDPNFALLER